VKYDDASWHYGADNFPKDQPQEHGATHIALFLRWGFSKGWAGELHVENEPQEVQQGIDGSLSATEFFLKYCDGKLTNEDFTDEGNAFAAQYYGEDGLYLEDYHKAFGDMEYLAPESRHDFAKFSAVLDARLHSGVLTRQQVKPWWKLW
jgi:hypothetical protein